MNNLDSLSLKYFYNETKDYINGAIVQKIQLPSRYEVILNLRNLNNNKSENKKLYININPQYPHVCFINDITSKKRDINIPQKPPMFCMQLRKYLNGSKIKDYRLVQYERILELYFDYFDEIGSITKLCLAIELMGKHSNIILYNIANKTIIGSIHNVSQDKSSIREIYGGIKYIYPPLKEKLDILNISYSTFHNLEKQGIKELSNNIYYFNQSLLNRIIEDNKESNNIFEFMQNLENLNNKEYIINYWDKNSRTINEAIDNYYSNYLFCEILKTKKTKLKNLIQKDYKKLHKTTQAPIEESKKENYKLFADYILAYSYRINKGDKFFEIDNIKIELDENLNAIDNSQKYYSLYKKAKTAQEYNLKRYNEAKEKLEYLNTIIFNIDNSSSFDELKGSSEELAKLGYVNLAKDNSYKNESNNRIPTIEFKGFLIYIGKNNKQNDYLISKIAQGEDLWFHGQNFPSSHVILRIPNNKKQPDKEVLEFCAKLTKENSKAKQSGKTPIIMTKRKFLKKPPNTYPGYVTYKNETEIIID